jgi:hypothetical protein
MSPRALRLALIVGVLSVAAAYLGWTLRRPAAPEITMTGVYSEDWMTHCGPLEAKAQQACTARLDGLYGRTAGAAVSGGR